MTMPLLPSGYSVIKQRDFKLHRDGYCLYCGDRCVGFAETETKINQLLEFDLNRDRMHQAPLESRAKPKTFKGVAIE
jgi:hypothetical protein